MHSCETDEFMNHVYLSLADPKHRRKKRRTVIVITLKASESDCRMIERMTIDSNMTLCNYQRPLNRGSAIE